MLNSKVDSRDLIQFIPRATVFIVIVALYSTLFSFLRRPDTIQLSSQFVSGTVTPEAGDRKPSRIIKKAFTKSGPRNHGDRTGGRGGIRSVDPDAPWEQMEFVQIGHEPSTWLKSTPIQSHVSYHDPIVSNIQAEEYLPSRPDLPVKNDSMSDSLNTPPISNGSTMTRQISSGSTDTPETNGDPETPTTPDLPFSSSQQHLMEPGIKRMHNQSLSPVLSDYSAERKEIDQSLPVPIPYDEIEEEEEDGVITGRRRASGQTLKEFFQEHQGGMGDDTERGPTSSGGKGVAPISATAYFNRQASLLMLYFPLAVSGDIM
jgi:hypothetical protein